MFTREVGDDFRVLVTEFRCWWHSFNVATCWCPTLMARTITNIDVTFIINRIPQRLKGHNDSDPPKKYFCTGISLGVVLGLISHVVMFFSKNSAKKVSGQKLEKWPIFGLSKLIRNWISAISIFCSTDWWRSEFRHFYNWPAKIIGSTTCYGAF